MRHFRRACRRHRRPPSLPRAADASSPTPTSEPRHQNTPDRAPSARRCVSRPRRRAPGPLGKRGDGLRNPAHASDSRLQNFLSFCCFIHGTPYSTIAERELGAAVNLVLFGMQQGRAARRAFQNLKGHASVYRADLSEHGGGAKPRDGPSCYCRFSGGSIASDGFGAAGATG